MLFIRYLFYEGQSKTGWSSEMWQVTSGDPCRVGRVPCECQRVTIMISLNYHGVDIKNYSVV